MERRTDGGKIGIMGFRYICCRDVGDAGDGLGRVLGKSIQVPDFRIPLVNVGLLEAVDHLEIICSFVSISRTTYLYGEGLV